MADRIIVGLGNVGSRYVGTRHNIGFGVAHEVARRCHGQISRRRFDAAIIEARLDELGLVIGCPTTMMNLSGFSVAQLCRWYRTELDNLLVIYDELDLPFGTIRLRPGGGAGGHNGVQSVIDQLGSNEFARLRIGIGRPTSGTTTNHVLSKFRAEEQAHLDQIVELSADAAIHWARHGIMSAMNEFNRESVGIS